MKVWLVVAAAAVAVLVQVAPAAAGGFCAGYNGERVTDAVGDRVVMRDNCFGPTVVRVERGSSVRFVNRDATAHAVGGTAGSFGDMHASIGPGKLVSYTFERDGIFPYVCMLHPGMAGAVVVGDGVGPSSTKTIAATVSDAAANSGQPPAKGGGAVTSASIPVGLGIGAIWALTVFARRERRSRAGSASPS